MTDLLAVIVAFGKAFHGSFLAVAE